MRVLVLILAVLALAASVVSPAGAAAPAPCGAMAGQDHPCDHHAPKDCSIAPCAALCVGCALPGETLADLATTQPAVAAYGALEPSLLAGRTIGPEPPPPRLLSAA